MRIATLSLLFLVACSSTPETTSLPSTDEQEVVTPPEGPTPVEQVMTMLAGRFDSSAQAATNPSYYDVSLTACPVSLAELGENVLYIEQALSGSGAPYRQRLYVVEDGDNDTVVSHVFEIANEADWVGACDAAEQPPMNGAIEREGCRVELSASEDGRWVGSTPGKSCLSTLQGATYATSEVELSEDKIVSWDRGWSDDDQQVWGATAGAYVFDRLQ